MAGQERLTPALKGLAVVQFCWMCGARLRADQMVADGGSACADVRWYCLDTRGCTQRWTSRSAKPADIRHATAGASQVPQAASRSRRRPASPV